MIWKVILISLSLLFQFTVNAQDEGITISTGGLPLEQRIPFSKSHSGRIILFEYNKTCHIGLTANTNVDLELPAPCDIKTKGATYSFDPDVSYNDKSDKPEESATTFEVVGGLRYFPNRRAECGKISRIVTLKWKKEIVKGKTAYMPYTELGKITDESSGRQIVCPRKYDDIK